MAKKIFALAAFLLVFGVLFSSHAYAVEVSIDSVRVNGRAFAESETNFIEDVDDLDVVISLTAIEDLSNIHAEAILIDLDTGNTVADSSGTFILKANQNTLVALSLRLIDSLKRQKDFRLEVKVVDVEGNTEEKSFGLMFTDRRRDAGALDISIDRVRVNSKIVAESKTNFIEESDIFDVLMDFTALEDLEDAHAEAVLKDLRSGFAVADASPNFDLGEDSSSSRALRLELLDKLKHSDSFELTVRIIDAEGNSVQKTFGIMMRDGRVEGAEGILRQLGISIDSIEVESEAVAENENNFIVISEGEKKLDLRVRMTALESIEDAHVDAVLAFENGDVVADATTTFDIDDGESTIKRLEMPLISPFEQNSFKLKVKVVDAEGNFEEKIYGLKISQSKFPFVISSISLSPEDSVEAGKALVASLSFKNSGVMPLEGINAKVSIPELGISSTKFVDRIKNSRLPEVREDFILKILDNVPTGTYTLRTEIASQFGSESEIKELPFFVVGKSEQAKQTVNEKLVINVPVVKQDMPNDGTEVIFPLVLTNQGPDANAYTILLDGAGWANLRLDSSNVLVIKPKESKTINVFASAKANAAAGEQIFLAAIKSDDKALRQIPFKGNVIPAKGVLAAKLKSALEIILTAFVISLVAIGIFFGVKRHIEGNNEEYSKGLSEEIAHHEQGESYY